MLLLPWWQVLVSSPSQAKSKQPSMHSHKHSTCFSVYLPHELSLHHCQVLHVAVLMRNQEAVQALLESGFSSMCRNSRRWTALDEAISTRHHGITKLLYMHAYAYKKQRMKEKKAQLLTTCNELPNYSVKVCSNQGAADLCLLLHFTVRMFDVVGHLGNCDEACRQL